MRKWNKEEILELVVRIRNGEGADEEVSRWIDEISDSVPNRNVVEAIMSDEDATAEDVVEKLYEGVYPMAEIDGGNLLCVEATTGKIYVWLHDEPEGEDLFLAATSLMDLLERMEKMPAQETKGSGIIVESVRVSEELLEALRNYKK